MRHRVKIKHLGRDTKARKALLTGLLRDLVQHGQIVTTVAKAKELKRQADKVIYRARVDSLATRRNLHQIFGKRDVVNTLVDKIGPLFKNRISGYTRITKLAKRRGDNTPMAKISLVEMPKETGLKNPAPKKADAAKVSKKASEKKAPAKKAAPKKKAATKETKKSAAKSEKAAK